MCGKGSERPDGDARKKIKYRVVFGGYKGNGQSWEAAVFQRLGSSPASMSAGKFWGYYSCVEGNSGEQADAEQAYVQALLKGPETWVYIPPGGRPAGWSDGAFGHQLFASERHYTVILTVEVFGKNTAISDSPRLYSSPLRPGHIASGTSI